MQKQKELTLHKVFGILERVEVRSPRQTLPQEFRNCVLLNARRQLQSGGGQTSVILDILFKKYFK